MVSQRSLMISWRFRLHAMVVVLFYTLTLAYITMTPLRLSRASFARCVSRVSSTEIREKAPSVGAHEAASTTASSTVKLAQELIRIESVTPNDNGCQDMLSKRLEKVGFVVESMKFEDVSNTWAVRGGESKPLLVFAGHTDVVPTGPLEKWKFPPYSGAIDSDGYLHGRGSCDMKGSIASFVVACERFVQKYPNHDGSIGLLLTSDEEGVARWGTREVISKLEERNVSIDMCIVGEPTSHQKCGDTIKVGRRGSLSGELTIYGTQGHVAYPHLADNPLHSALGPLKALVETEWDQGNENFPPTTFQISNIFGGTGATNVIPGHKTVHFNFRYSPETNDEELMAKVESTLDEHKINYKIDWSERAYPYETKRDSKLVEAVRDSIRDVTGLETDLSTSGGTSDGRFVAPTGAQVVELGPINASIHKIDERVFAADLDVLTDIYEDILVRVLCGNDGKCCDGEC